MSTIQDIRKWSDLKGLAVVTINNGEKVGTIDDFYFDTQHNLIVAFKVKTGLFGHRALLCSMNNAIGKDALTFASQDALIKEELDPRLQTLPLGSQLLNYRVLSAGGNVIGSIGNIYLDLGTPTTPRVSEYELGGGLRERLSGRYPHFSASHVDRYGSDVIVVPDTVAQTITTQQ